jgi:Tfp pilus assembly protein FimT
MVATGWRASVGYTMVELLIVLAFIALLAGMAFPMIGNMVGFVHLNGDMRALSNAVSLARMQAASNFSRSRLYVDMNTNGYHTELKANGAANWVASGPVTYLSAPTESYGFGAVSTAPPNTQATIAEATTCLDNASPAQPISNTACIVFNSRGIPIDSTGAPTGVYALYVTDGTDVYGVTVSATSIIRTWRTISVSTPAWNRQ